MDGLNYIIELLQKKKFGMFARAYVFTTENISGYYDKLEFENKKVLTVTASGDQALNAVLFGSKEIDCFDSNPLAKYILELKIAAIKALSKKSFLDYFCQGYMSFNINTYLKIRKYLTKDYLFFWDSLYEEFSSDKLRELIINTDEHKRDKIISFNPYLQNYDVIKSKIKDISISYFTCDITELTTILEKEYSTIVLSNIMQYAEWIYPKDALINFKKLLIQLTNFLENKGKIMCDYLYYFDFDNYEYEVKKDIFTKEEYDYLEIDGIRNGMDGVILFTK